MSESVHTNTSLWSKGMKAVIVAQFLSAFGDNALLFATLALLKAQFYPEWSQPILQMLTFFLRRLSGRWRIASPKAG